MCNGWLIQPMSCLIVPKVIDPSHHLNVCVLIVTMLKIDALDKIHCRSFRTRSKTWGWLMKPLSFRLVSTRWSRRVGVLGPLCPGPLRWSTSYLALQMSILSIFPTVKLAAFSPSWSLSVCWILFWLWFAVIKTNTVTEEVPGTALFLTTNGPPQPSNSGWFCCHWRKTSGLESGDRDVKMYRVLECPKRRWRMGCL